MSIAFDTHQQTLVKNVAYRVFRRLVAAGVRVISVEDVYQELCIGWCVARNKFDQSNGVPFDAYARTGMLHFINRWVQGKIDAHIFESVSLDDSHGENENNFHEVIAGNSISIDDTIEFRQTRNLMLSRLSARARQFIELLESPPDFLLNSVRESVARAEYAAQRGIKSMSIRHFKASLVFRFMNVNRLEQTKIYAEIAQITQENQ